MVLFESLWYDAALAAVSVLTGLYFYIKYRQSYFERKGIPHIKPVFLLGGSLKPMLLLEPFEDVLEKSYKALKQYGYGGVYGFLTPAFYICDPELIQRVLIKDFSHFNGNGIEIDEKTNPLEGHLFNLSGAKWRSLRNKLSPAFTSGRLKWMFPQINVCGERMVKFLRENVGEEDYSIRDVCSRYGMDVIASCAFGLDLDTMNEPDCEFRKMAHRIFHPSKLQILKALLFFNFRKLVLKLKLKTVEPDVEKFFFDLTKGAFEYRQKTNQKRNDFIQLLLQLREKGYVETDPRDREELEIQGNLLEGDSSKIEITDGLLTAQSFIFFSAGFEQSATLMAYLLNCFTKYPDVQDDPEPTARNIQSGGVDRVTALYCLSLWRRHGRNSSSE